MPPLLLHLGAFAGYTLALLLLTGQAFAWNETRSLFYLGGRRTGMWMSLATFCATWMSAASVVGFTLWMMQDGFRAFGGSVNGWLLGLVPMPLLVFRLRRVRCLSLPEWLARIYGDERLRRLGGGALLFAYTLYLVIQFRAFGAVAAHLLQLPLGFAAAALVYLFVLYTTFGGYPSVVRSDALNLCLILAGVTLAAGAAIHLYGSPLATCRVLAVRTPELLNPWSSWREGITTLTLGLAWGLGVAANPQYGVRLMAARRTRDALGMLCAAPLFLGWIYLCLTVLGLVGRASFPHIPQTLDPTAFARLFDGTLPVWGALPLLVAVLAAAVSTANSQLLLAACSLCHDLLPQRPPAEQDPFGEDRFLLQNRLAIVAIATVSLVLSQIPLPGILALGRMSWTVVAVCFLFPLYLPRRMAPKQTFAVLASALGVHALLSTLSPLTPETSMLVALAFEGTFWILPGRAGS